MPAPVFISYPRDHSLGQYWATQIDDYLSQSIGCWRDVNDIKSGAFSYAIQAGIEKCAVVLVVLSRQTINSEWVLNEVNHAKRLKKPIVMVFVEAGAEVLFELNHLNPLPIIKPNGSADWARLLRELAPYLESPSLSWDDVSKAQRQDEQIWLADLLNRRLLDYDQFYEPLQAHERKGNSLLQRLPPAIAHTDLILNRFVQANEGHHSSSQSVPSEKFDDVLLALNKVSQRQLPHMALLGEPGAGKTFSMRRMALALAQKASADVREPLPLLASLKHWTRPDESLENFLSRELGNQCLGRHWRKLRESKRAFLLLDAINELPSEQHAAKAEQLRDFIRHPLWQGVVVSCRSGDYQKGYSLPLDTLELQPLNPVQVHDFVCRYLSNTPEQAQQCFWAIAGGSDVRQAFEVLQEQGFTLELFWSDEDLNERFEKSHALSSEYRVCKRVRADARGLIKLAANPYLLNLMVQIYNRLGDLPRSRSQLFSSFIETLIEREAKLCKQRAEPVPGVEQIKTALQDLAMQMQRTQFRRGGYEAANISVPVADCPKVLSELLRQQACSASLLVETDQQVSFCHQLMQEFFAANGLWQLIQSDEIKASELWSAERWWERNGWETTLEILMEGLLATQHVTVLQWLGEANADLASKLWLEAGKPELLETWLSQYRNDWLPRINNTDLEPCSNARVAAARALGRWGLDTRKGVGLGNDGLPEIDWVHLPKAQFYFQGEVIPRTAKAFDMSRYLVTNAQFQAFIDDDGYWTDQWWRGLAQRFYEPVLSDWHEANSPRVKVSWYEAMAFCRWMSERTGLEIKLPTEHRFERAARGPDYRPANEMSDYPWRGVMTSGRIDMNETINEFGKLNLSRTAAVGTYPLGRSVEGVEDLSGNVWEWCLNEFQSSEKTSVDGDTDRVLRGGSWFSNHYNCRSAYRSNLHPVNRNNSVGFRLSCFSQVGEC